MRDIIAERELDFRLPTDTETKKVVVRLGRPEVEGAGPNWYIHYEIEGPDAAEMHRGVVRGEDSMQTLVLALQIVPAELAAFARRGELMWLGGPDLGFVKKS
jgi:hypothetical protein